MEIQNLSVSINGETPREPIEIIVREGAAQSPELFFEYTIEGTITTVRTAINTYPIDPKRAVVKYSYERGELGIRTNMNSNHGSQFNGVLRVNPDLEKLRINQPSSFDQKALLQLVTQYAHLFDSIEEAKALRKKLLNFTAKLEQQIKQEDDRSGNTQQSFSTALKYTKGELPEVIYINAPLFVGQSEVTIALEIEVDIDNSRPLFSFFSMDYESLLRSEARRVIDEELAAIPEEYAKIGVV